MVGTQAVVTEPYLFTRKVMRSGGTGVRKQLREARFSLLLHQTTVGHSEQVHSVPIERVAQQLPMVIHGARRTKDVSRPMGRRETAQGEVGKQSECVRVCAVPVWRKLSSFGEALVKLLQHLLALTVREREAEGEEGGRPSQLRQPVRERKDELIIYNLERKQAEMSELQRRRKL